MTAADRAYRAYGYDRKAFDAAHRLLATLAVGDRVLVTKRDGTSAETTVTRAGFSDGAYGSWESYRVACSLGPGRYTWDVDAHKLATGELSVAKIV